MWFRVSRLRRGRKIRRKCGRLCGRCGRWIGRWVRDGYGSRSNQSQNPHPVAESATRMGHPRFLLRLVRQRMSLGGLAFTAGGMFLRLSMAALDELGARVREGEARSEISGAVGRIAADLCGTSYSVVFCAAAYGETGRGEDLSEARRLCCIPGRTRLTTAWGRGCWSSGWESIA